MEDVITVLNFPEWPAAEMIVHIFSKIMVMFIEAITVSLLCQLIIFTR